MSDPKIPVQNFFTAFENGNFSGLMATLHDDVKVITGGTQTTPVYGTFDGHEGASTFLGGLGEHFDTQAFSVDAIIGEGDTAFASGSFTHRVKSTDKLFESDWVLLARVKDDKIIRYQFFEDTAGAVEAFKR